MIHVDKNIPLPPHSDGRKSKTAFPWEQLEIGDSFLFPKDTKRNQAASQCYYHGHRSDKKFAIRLVKDGIRCWRTT